ncbi:MAG: hypothetical protein HY842_00605 [Bacteroidetes bacterium]|nr:hypothetical protein [Bacteroidota bacterium]
MKLADLEQAEYQFLKHLYDTVESQTDSIYSAYCDPFELGAEIGMDNTVVRRIMSELVRLGQVQSTLGMDTVILKQAGVNRLRDQERLNESLLQNTYNAYYLSRDDYGKIEVERDRYKNRRCYLKIQILNHIGSESFTARMMWNSFVYFSKENSYSNGIIRDYEEGKSGFFTFDFFGFYEVKSLKLDFLGIYEFTFSKYPPIKMDATSGVNLNNISNSTIQLQNNSQNAQQFLSVSNGDFQTLAKELKSNLNKLTSQIQESQRAELVTAVDFLESQLRRNNNQILPSIIVTITDTLKAVPVETLAGILSAPILRLLGF